MRCGDPVVRAVVGLAFLLGLAGCSSLGLSSNKALTGEGLPKKKFLVGGGMSIQYVAPADGQVYWVEQTTQKILAMKSVKAGEKAEFGSERMDADSVKESLGVSLKDANFRLYFVPNEEE